MQHKQSMRFVSEMPSVGSDSEHVTLQLHLLSSSSHHISTISHSACGLHQAEGLSLC